MSEIDLKVPDGTDDPLSVFEIMQRFRADGSCEKIISAALKRRQKIESLEAEIESLEAQLAQAEGEVEERDRRIDELESKLRDGLKASYADFLNTVDAIDARDLPAFGKRLAQIINAADLVDRQRDAIDRIEREISDAQLVAERRPHSKLD